MTRVFIATPRLRTYAPALMAAYQMLHSYGKPVEWHQVQHDQPEGHGMANVLHNYDVLRNRFLASDCTHFLALEDDMVPPPDGVDRLLACDAPVAYGLYCWRRRAFHWNAYKTLLAESGCSIMDDNPFDAVERARRQEVIDVRGLGLGFTLIRREVLERIAWRWEGPTGGANDWYFALDCAARGVRQVAHLGVLCGHITQEPSYRIIWPDPHADGQRVAKKDLHRVELLPS
jgi:hypothetical protein